MDLSYPGEKRGLGMRVVQLVRGIHKGNCPSLRSLSQPHTQPFHLRTITDFITKVIARSSIIDYLTSKLVYTTHGWDRGRLLENAAERRSPYMDM